MTNIRCIVLTKGRAIKTFNVSDRKDYLVYKKGAYSLSKGMVNLTAHIDSELNPTPELIFVERNPLPLTIKPEASDNAKQLLSATIVENALKSVTPGKGLLGDILRDYASNPMKVLILLFALIIVGAVAGSLMGFI